MNTKSKALEKSKESEYVTVGLFNDEMKNIDKRFDKVEADIAGLKYDMQEVKGDVKRIEAKMDKNHETMVTFMDKQLKLMEGMRDDFQIIKSENRQIKQVIKNKFDIEIIASAL